MTDLNKIINEQRERIAKLEQENALLLIKTLPECNCEGLQERIAELEQSQVPNGYIAVPADAWHELCQQEQRAEAAEKRLAEVERERDKLRCAVATAIDVFDDYDMDVETYAPIKHVKMKQGLRDSLNKFAIEQQIKALEDFKENTSFDMHTSISFNLRVEQLRQQLNGGE